MTPDEEMEMQEAIFQASYWKQVAAQLAHCEIATAETFCDLKSVSAYNKGRLAGIVITCLDLLTHKQCPKQFASSPDYADEKVKNAAERAKSFIEHHGKMTS